MFLKTCYLVALVSIVCALHFASGQSLIAVDQLGYRPGDQKKAIARDVAGRNFEIKNLETNKTVFHGTIKPVGIRDGSTGDILFSLDFSLLEEPGLYGVWIPGSDAVSREFRIDRNVYRRAALASLQSFYYQRCGTEVKNGTVWTHPVCHGNDAPPYAGAEKVKDVTGGWHDAGDYNKFIVTGAVSVAFLLSLYELRPTQFVDAELSIPEAGNSVPDILDEVRWELDWLLKMQQDDGGISHKVSAKKWAGEYLPHRDPATRYLFDPSSAATGAFAAVTALSARIYQQWDKPFAQRLLRAAVHAWGYLENHPTIVPSGGFQNPPDVEGGEYGDDHDQDERLWASAELFHTTEHDKYHQYFLRNYQQLGGITTPVSWQHVQNLAYYTYLRTPRTLGNGTSRSFILATLSKYCDDRLQRIEQNGYRSVLATDEYYWGSNSVALGYAYDLVQAYEATRLRRYLDGALDQLHVLLGCNPFDQSFVTGIGTNPVRHPYHQFSMMLKAGDPVPGLVVGGPNSSGRLRGKVISEFPGKCYEDNEKNYFVNEVAINYTAPFAFLAGYFSESAEAAKNNVSVKK